MEIVGPLDVGSAQYQGELNALLEGREIQWYKGHYLRPNLILFLLLITSMYKGYDGDSPPRLLILPFMLVFSGSIMNDLQTVTNWQVYFNRENRESPYVHTG